MSRKLLLKLTKELEHAKTMSNCGEDEQMWRDWANAIQSQINEIDSQIKITASQCIFKCKGEGTRKASVTRIEDNTSDPVYFEVRGDFPTRVYTKQYDAIQSAVEMTCY